MGSISKNSLCYLEYEGEHQIPVMMQLMEKDLSEPYSVYTYRYFVHNWPKLCILAMDHDKCVGAVISKLDDHKGLSRGYIGMLAVDKDYRKLGIATELVKRSIMNMEKEHCEEVVLETEITNIGALNLYENLGFLRDKRLHRYYMNGGDAFRLKLFLKQSKEDEEDIEQNEVT